MAIKDKVLEKIETINSKVADFFTESDNKIIVRENNEPKEHQLVSVYLTKETQDRISSYLRR